MKKYLFPLLALLCCMTACQKEETGILNLVVERYASEGKMHLDDDNYAVWDNGDDIYFEGTRKIVTVSNEKATISDVTAMDNYHAIYPYEWARNINTICYPAVQHYRTNDQGKQVIDAPMVALCVSGSNTLYFHNVGSLLKVAVTNNTGDDMKVRRIVVTSESTPIHGSTTVNYSDFTLSGPTDGGNTVTLDIKEGVSVPSSSTDYFYIALPPVDAKLTIKVYDDAFSYTKSQATSHAMQKNHGYTAPINTNEAAAVQFAPTSKQIWYTTDNNTITPYPGSGMSPSDNGYNATLECYVMTFANEITELQSTAFYGNSTLKTITLPSSVTRIGSSAFYTCTALTTITIPDGVIDIEASAFSGCANLETVNIPSSVTTIGSFAFSNCDQLSSITMSNVTSIGSYAFSYCDRLSSITMSNVTSIGAGAFKGCTSLNSITLPRSVTTIGEEAFAGCTGLTSITMTNVTSIGGEAFRNCTSLNSITIPGSVTSIGNNAFDNASNLTEFNFDGTMALWNLVTKGTFWNTNCAFTTVHCSDGDVNVSGN